MKKFNIINTKLEKINFKVGKYSNIIDYILYRINTKNNFILLPCTINDLASVSENKKIQKLYKKVDIATTDGVPIAWYLSYKLKTKVERGYGPQIMKDVLKLTQGTKHRHCLYGTSEDTLKKLEAEIRNFAPEINIVLSISHPTDHLQKKEETQYINTIKEKKVTIIWIGISSPKQVVLATTWKNKLPNTNFFCVGAAFDFNSNNKKSSPKLLQQMGLEWLFRLITEPKRLWRRYLVIGPLYLLKKLVAVFR